MNTAFLDLPMGVGTPIPAPRLGTSQNVSYNAAGGAATSSVAVGGGTQMVQIGTKASASGTGVRVAIGFSPVADGNAALIPPGAVLYYRVYGGELVSVISDDSNTGSINVVECV